MNLTQGTARESIASTQVAKLRSAGVLIEDARRERPRYFDGRFLAARDLIRDQQYFLTREADLGRAAGSGVAAGLFVEEGNAPQTLKVAGGHGITPAGELVLLPRDLDVQLANIPVAEQLSVKFGLSRLPAPPMRSRTGLFVLALRPVEFTANPIGAYPTSITGQRTVEDGDVIEATVVVLVPWQDDGAADALDARRGRVARNVFVSGDANGLSANVLPLAMLALQNNTIVWIDEAMVRRELGANRGDLPGLGFAPRALRIAHLMQYQDHLQYVQEKSNNKPFPASAHFPALPSAGPLPPNVINTQDFTQNFFPAEIDVDFSIVPEDELPALVEEALALQPIDLTAPAVSLDSTAVMILAPVPRHEWRSVMSRLESVTRVIKPAAPNLLAQRKPFEVLQRLRVPRPALGTVDSSNPSDAEWQRLARLPSLWFVRRRHLAYRDDYTGVWQQVSGVDERATELALKNSISNLGLSSNLDKLLKNSTPAAASTITGLLSSSKFQESPTLTAAALGSLSAAAEKNETLDQAAVLKVAADLNKPGTGDGLVKVENAVGSEKVSAETLKEIAASEDWKRVDTAASVANKTELIKIASEDLNVDASRLTTPTGTKIGTAGTLGGSKLDTAGTTVNAGSIAAGTGSVVTKPVVTGSTSATGSTTTTTGSTATGIKPTTGTTTGTKLETSTINTTVAGTKISPTATTLGTGTKLSAGTTGLTSPKPRKAATPKAPAKTTAKKSAVKATASAATPAGTKSAGKTTKAGTGKAKTPAKK